MQSACVKRERGHFVDGMHPRDSEKMKKRHGHVIGTAMEHDMMENMSSALYSIVHVRFDSNRDRSCSMLHPGTAPENEIRSKHLTHAMTHPHSLSLPPGELHGRSDEGDHGPQTQHSFHECHCPRRPRQDDLDRFPRPKGRNHFLQGRRRGAIHRYASG